jgi:hypothetical protein
VEGHHIPAIIISAESTKTGSLDVLPIPERLWQELIAQGWRSGFLFRNSHGDKWSNWMYQMGKLKEAFPIDDVGWFRDGRRGMATFNCDQQGLPRYAVKAVTGHKTTRMFDVYAIGTLKGKLMVTHPEFFRKDGGEGTNGAQLLQM